MCFVVISQWCPCVLDMHIGIGVGTMGAMGAGAPPMFSDNYVARLNFIHTDYTALAYRSLDPTCNKYCNLIG